MRMRVQNIMINKVLATFPASAVSDECKGGIDIVCLDRDPLIEITLN